MAETSPLPNSKKLDLATLQKALPSREYEALSAYLTTFFPFQREWILDWSRIALCLKARQIGASHSYSFVAALWGLFGETTTLLSLGEREANVLLNKVFLHCKALEKLGSKWCQVTRRTTEQITLASGGQIIALPSTSGGRSYSGNVILDEFAYLKNPDETWDGVAGTITHGFRLRVASTPNGVGNLFAKLWKDPKVRYTKHKTTIDEAIAQGMKVDQAELWDAVHHDKRLFEQVYRCSFLDNEEQYIPTELVDAAIVTDEAAVLGTVFAGLDIGRTADLTVLTILVLDYYGHAWVVEQLECKRTAYEDLEELVAYAVATHGVKRLCIDGTGIGAFPSEQLQNRFGKERIVPITFTLSSKEILATTLFQRFADKSISFAMGDGKLHTDICSIRRIVTQAGNVRYDAPHTAEGHADRAWSLALALHAANQPVAGRSDSGYGN